MAKSNRINLGINILRVWMAFEVILLHRMSWKGYDDVFFRFLKECELFSVPVFMIIAFYLCGHVLESGNKEKIKERFIRLLIPQVGWAVLCFIAYAAMDIVFAHHLSIGFKDLLIAIISGCREGINPSTWFQAVLIILTALYCLIFRLFRKREAWYVVYLTLVIAVFVQENGFYYDFFADKPYEIANTIGRIFEMMPFAAAGLLLYHYDIFKRYKKRRYLIMAVTIVLFVFGFKIPFPRYKGFFEGLYPLYMALCLFLIFLYLPLDDVSGNSRLLIMKITRFTLGIYCAHRLVYSVLDVVYELIKFEPPNFSKCLLTYLACYLMSYIMSLIPTDIFKKMVD